MPSTDLDLARAFAGLTDPRIDRTKKHELTDIVVIALCAVICGAVPKQSLGTRGSGGHWAVGQRASAPICPIFRPAHEKTPAAGAARGGRGGDGCG